ncbi:DUF6834 family protein [Archaeoglobus veneficus]|uniref:Uncharacterized protein n=1 Tax=Archaeoglobus veneficus (strain DSM 11195 / SNP6) TaxID=693661 RepID=F2KNS2_ARCVS|nr:hypothetical protein [Archaeoglobus veneficus]AEA47399.1 hypothetical protein Arcve_1395 [Archaeoglobus veneficus SNP6]
MREVVVRVVEKIGRSIVTEEEIERVCRRVLLELNLCPHEIVEEVKRALLREPVTLSTFYSDRFEVGSATYYCIHGVKPKPEELDKAYEEFVKSRKFLDSLELMEKLVDEFFYDYSVREGVVREYVGRRKYGVFFSLIDDVFEDVRVHARFASSYSGEYVIVVPTEDSPIPFIKFFRKYSELINSVGLKIWVVDVEREAIDPYIGYPRDLKLIGRFRNPRLATEVASLWRVNVKEADWYG